MISVVVAEDRVLVRAGLRTLIDAEPDLTVVAQACDRFGAAAAAYRCHPDVVLLEASPPELSALEATRAMTTDPRLDGVRVVLLAAPPVDGYVLEAIRYGASGVLMNDAEPAELLRGIRAAGAGHASLSPIVARHLVDEFAARTRTLPADARLARLSSRETEVVGLVAGGCTNDDIAARLVISPTTARTHISRAMVKLGVHCRAQLVVLAYETGLVRAGWTA